MTAAENVVVQPAPARHDELAHLAEEHAQYMPIATVPTTATAPSRLSHALRIAVAARAVNLLRV